MSDGQFRIMLADNKLGELPREKQLPELTRLGLWPMFASPKLDGIRALVRGGEVVSRTLKRIPSTFAQETFEGLEGFDGELICGDPCSPTCFRETVSAATTHGATTPLTYCVFDLTNEAPTEPYVNRLDKLRNEADKVSRYGVRALEHVRVLPQHVVHNEEQAQAYEEECLDLGYEGVILRHPASPYKYGRSTLKQGWMVKLKRFLDSEAKIIGFEELQRNDNVAKVDALGYTKRSSHQEGKVGMDTLGALVCVDPKFPGFEIKIGVFKGYSKLELQEIWKRQDEYLGRLVKYIYVLYGSKDRPRHSRAVGFRHKMDT